DLDTCDLAFSVVTPPANGPLGTITAAPCAAGLPNTDSATVLFTPTAGYSGTDTFTFQVNDGASAALLPGTVAITIASLPIPIATPTIVLPLPTATPTVTPIGPTPSPTPGGNGLCGDTPRAGCKNPFVSKGAILTMTKRADPAKDRLSWKWGKGSATAKGDFGIPTQTTDYQLCIYDGNGELVLAARAPKGD